MTKAPAARSSSLERCNKLNGPSSSTSDPQNQQRPNSSDNEADSETDDEALQKEISRLREKCVKNIHQASSFTSPQFQTFKEQTSIRLFLLQTHDRDS